VDLVVLLSARASTEAVLVLPLDVVLVLGALERVLCQPDSVLKPPLCIRFWGEGLFTLVRSLRRRIEDVELLDEAQVEGVCLPEPNKTEEEGSQGACETTDVCKGLCNRIVVDFCFKNCRCHVMGCLRVHTVINGCACVTNAAHFNSCPIFAERVPNRPKVERTRRNLYLGLVVEDLRD